MKKKNGFQFRKYYDPLCGYLGSTLEKYADCLFQTGKREKVKNIFWMTSKTVFVLKAKTVMEETHDIMKIIPGTENYYYKKYFLPKYLGIRNASIN